MLKHRNMTEHIIKQNSSSDKLMNPLVKSSHEWTRTSLSACRPAQIGIWQSPVACSAAVWDVVNKHVMADGGDDSPHSARSAADGERGPDGWRRAPPLSLQRCTHEGRK